ncbi:MAG: PqiC family protein [Burkholderiales bacterium]
MRLVALLVSVLAALGLAAACSTPSFHFYTLSAANVPAAPATNLVVALGPVTVPAVVDRPEMVVSTGANQVMLDDTHRWASPLPDNLARVMAEDLALMLGSPRVIQFGQALAPQTDYRVAVDFRSFDSMLGSYASVDAIWTIHRTKDRKLQAGHTAVRESVADPSYQALAGAHSRAVAKLSQDIAAAILAMQREGPASQ